MSGKVLVTGADGFIGSHLVEALVRNGVDVRAFVLYNSFNSWGWLDSAAADVKKSIEVVAGDIRDPHCVRSAMDSCEAVIHLAALIAIPYSYHAPSSYVETNISGTLNLLTAARDLNVGHFIHTSTSEVYGTAQRVPIDEEHPLQGQSPYAATKIGADQMALAFYRSFGLPVSVIRPFNTFGPRQSARAVIPTVITQALGGADVIKLGALHPTRDFTFVADTVSGFLAMMKSERTIGQVVNLGTNSEISIGDVVSIILAATGSKAIVQSDEQRIRPEKSEVDRLWSDNTKAKSLMKWKPFYIGHEGFAKAVAETVSWFRDPRNLERYKADIYNV